MPPNRTEAAKGYCEGCHYMYMRRKQTTFGIPIHNCSFPARNHGTRRNEDIQNSEYRGGCAAKFSISHCASRHERDAEWKIAGSVYLHSYTRLTSSGFSAAELDRAGIKSSGDRLRERQQIRLRTWFEQCLARCKL